MIETQDRDGHPILLNEDAVTFLHKGSQPRPGALVENDCIVVGLIGGLTITIREDWEIFRLHFI